MLFLICWSGDLVDINLMQSNLYSTFAGTERFVLSLLPP